MTSPSSTAFLRPDIGQSFEEFDAVAARMGYIGPRVLPFMNVQLQSANFSKITIESLLRDTETLRAPGGGYNRDKYQFEQDSYTTTEYGAEEPVDDREKAIYAYSFDIERISALRAMGRVLRDYEKRVAAATFDTSVWTGDLTTAVGTKWNTPGSATPIDDVLDAHESVRNSCGMLPNAVIMSWVAFKELQKNDQIIDQIKYSGRDDPKQVTLDALASLFQVEEVIVAGGVKSTAKEGQPAAIDDIWNKAYVMVAKLCRSQDLREPCIGRTFHFVGDGSSEGGTVEQYRDERLRSDVMRTRMDYQPKIIYPQAGHLLTNIYA